MQIRRDDLTSPEIRALLEEHLANMRTMLTHIFAKARRRSYERLSLETGTQAPFGDYKEDPNSVFMTLRP